MKLFIASNAIITTGFLLLSSVACSSKPGSYADRNTSADRTTNPPAATVSDADRDFVAKAAQGGMAEVDLGKLAQERGATQQTKDFGKMLVDDHTRLSNELKSIANSENIPLPADMGEKHQKAYDRLAKLSGADFDRAFYKDSVSNHKNDIDEFKEQANKGADSALRHFASRSLPTLQDHLRWRKTKG